MKTETLKPLGLVLLCSSTSHSKKYVATTIKFKHAQFFDIDKITKKKRCGFVVSCVCVLIIQIVTLNSIETVVERNSTL